MKLHEIPLRNHDQPFIVSQEDAEIRILLNWRLHRDGYVIRYEQDKEKNRSRVIFAHRIIASRMLERPLVSWPNEVVSHINKNLLDCSRHNLRVITMGEAATARSSLSTNTSSIYRGVSWNNVNKNWVSYIKLNGIQIHLGSYSSEADAALAYDVAARVAFEDLAQLNFPEQEERNE